MSFSIDAGKTLDKIQTYVWKKCLENENKEEIPQVDKEYLQNPTARLNKVHFPKIGSKAVMSTLPSYLNSALSLSQ